MSETGFATSIETPRLWLRCPLPGDGEMVHQGVAESLRQLREWPDSLPWAQNEQSVRVSEDYCQTCFAACVMQVAWPLLVFDKATQSFMGTVGFHHIDWSRQVWELGYWCRLSFQRQGRMTEPVHALSRLASDGWPEMQLTARVDQRNTGSIKVLQRAGYVLVKQEDLADASGEQRTVLHHAWGRELHTGQST